MTCLRSRQWHARHALQQISFRHFCDMSSDMNGLSWATYTIAWLALAFDCSKVNNLIKSHSFGWAFHLTQSLRVTSRRFLAATKSLESSTALRTMKTCQCHNWLALSFVFTRSTFPIAMHYQSVSIQIRDHIIHTAPWHELIFFVIFSWVDVIKRSVLFNRDWYEYLRNLPFFVNCLFWNLPVVPKSDFKAEKKSFYWSFPTKY